VAQSAGDWPRNREGLPPRLCFPASSAWALRLRMVWRAAGEADDLTVSTVAHGPPMPSSIATGFTARALAIKNARVCNAHRALHRLPELRAFGALRDAARPWHQFWCFETSREAPLCRHARHQLHESCSPHYRSVAERPSRVASISVFSVLVGRSQTHVSSYTSGIGPRSVDFASWLGGCCGKTTRRPSRSKRPKQGTIPGSRDRTARRRLNVF